MELIKSNTGNRAVVIAHQAQISGQSKQILSRIADRLQTLASFPVLPALVFDLHGGKVERWLTLPALPQDLGSVPSISPKHLQVCLQPYVTIVSRDTMPSSGHQEPCMHLVHSRMCRQNT